jgi:hypothetical protein
MWGAKGQISGETRMSKSSARPWQCHRRFRTKENPHPKKTKGAAPKAKLGRAGRYTSPRMKRKFVLCATRPSTKFSSFWIRARA